MERMARANLSEANRGAAMSRGHILLAGIGSDSHCIGLTILRNHLTRVGFEVAFLGIQTPLTEIGRRAGAVDAVLISNMDGHAHTYLRGFQNLRQGFSPGRPLWYLGGYFAVDFEPGMERLFFDIGFDRVLYGYQASSFVQRMLEHDLEWAPGEGHCGRSSAHAVIPLSSPLPCQPPGLKEVRPDVLRGWRTGSDARRLNLNAEFLQERRSLPSLQALVNQDRSPILVQPRSGVCSPGCQLAQFEELVRCGANVLSFQVDSLTRASRFEDVAGVLRSMDHEDEKRLNGYPLVNHGVGPLRTLAASVSVPLQTRHSARDPRLLAELSYAGGVTGFEGGPISYNLPYYKRYPLEEAFANWRYVDELTSLYHERFAILLDREFFGVLTAALIPPCLAIATNVLEAILAAKYGVKSVSLGYAEQGHRVQDVAAIRTLRKMAQRALDDLGYRNVEVSTVFHQYMAAFPPSRRRAEELILNSAVTAGLASPTRILVKSPVEALRIPSIADNVQGLHLVQQGLRLSHRYAVDEDLVACEGGWIEAEVRCLLDSIGIDTSKGLEQRVSDAFSEGRLDIPFSPSLLNRGEAVTARDVEGGVRFLSFGNLPFSPEICELHGSKMDERRRAEGLTSRAEDSRIVEKDVLRVPREEYDSWPLCGSACECLD